MGEPSKLFEGLKFGKDPDVDAEVVTCVESSGGSFSDLKSLESSSPIIWLVNQRYADVTSHNRPNTVYVFQNWVNMCTFRRTRVDCQPYSVECSESCHSTMMLLLALFAQSPRSVGPSGQSLVIAASSSVAPAAAQLPTKKTRGDRYTEQEDEKLWMFGAVTHLGTSMSQEVLWRHAEDERLLENRSWLSMMKRYRDLKHSRKVFDKTNQNYTKADDSVILRWVWLWHHAERRGVAASGKIWDIATQRQILMGREASQMYGRFKRLEKKFETTSKLMNYAASFQCLEEDKWSDLFEAKPSENTSAEGNNIV